MANKKNENTETAQVNAPADLVAAPVNTPPETIVTEPVVEGAPVKMVAVATEPAIQHEEKAVVTPAAPQVETPEVVEQRRIVHTAQESARRTMTVRSARDGMPKEIITGNNPGFKS